MVHATRVVCMCVCDVFIVSRKKKTVKAETNPKKKKIHSITLVSIPFSNFNLFDGQPWLITWKWILIIWHNTVINWFMNPGIALGYVRAIKKLFCLPRLDDGENQSRKKKKKKKKEQVLGFLRVLRPSFRMTSHHAFFTILGAFMGNSRKTREGPQGYFGCLPTMTAISRSSFG